MAVFELLPEVQFVLADRDIQVFTTKDSGPGGQHRNKTESCVVMRHIPTGIEAKAATKSQHMNRKTARAVLEARVKAHFLSIKQTQKQEERIKMRGSGQRGDKIRTYREQDDIVNSHITGSKARLRDIRKGGLAKLF